jgi:hypothetical protein
MTTRFAFLTTSIAAAVLATMAAPALAGQSARDAASYFVGEAAPPEVEARALADSMNSNTTRADVHDEFIAARDAGTLARAGDIAEPDAVLNARVAFNERQSQQILARMEADRAAALAALQPAQPSSDPIAVVAQAPDATASETTTVAAAEPPVITETAEEAGLVEPRSEPVIEPTAPLSPEEAQPQADAAVIRPEETPASDTAAPIELLPARPQN